jgi:hypothetical protein
VVRRLDPDGSPVRHGVARVHHEVHHHLFELPLVGPDEAQGGLVVEGQAHPLSHETVQEVGDVGQDGAQVESLGEHALLAGECEELSHEAGRAIHVLADLDEIRVLRVARVMAQQEQVRMAGDGSQEVVEVVRDAARELAKGLHLLALDELRLERLELGHVVEDGEEMGVLGGTCDVQRDADKHVLVLARAAEELGARGGPAGGNVGHPFAHGAAQPLKEVGQAHLAGRGDAQQGTRVAIGRQDEASGRQSKQRDRQALEGRPPFAGRCGGCQGARREKEHVLLAARSVEDRDQPFHPAPRGGDAMDDTGGKRRVEHQGGQVRGRRAGEVPERFVGGQHGAVGADIEGRRRPVRLAGAAGPAVHAPHERVALQTAGGQAPSVATGHGVLLGRPERERLVPKVRDQGGSVRDLGPQDGGEGFGALAPRGAVARQDEALCVGDEAGRRVVVSQCGNALAGRAAALVPEEAPALLKEDHGQQQLGREAQDEARPGVGNLARDREDDRGTDEGEQGGGTDKAGERRNEGAHLSRACATGGQLKARAGGHNGGVGRQHGVRSFESIPLSRPHNG